MTKKMKLLQDTKINRKKVWKFQKIKFDLPENPKTKVNDQEN